MEFETHMCFKPYPHYRRGINAIINRKAHHWQKRNPTTYSQRFPTLHNTLQLWETIYSAADL